MNRLGQDTEQSGGSMNFGGMGRMWIGLES